MRYKLPFQDVASIVELSSEYMSLPENIVFAQGDTRTEKRNDAARILSTQGHVNAVVMLEPVRAEIEEAMFGLHALALGKRLRTKQDLVDSFEKTNVGKTLSDYLERRSQQHTNPLIANLDIKDISQAASRVWHKSLEEVSDLEPAFLNQSIITYVPNYSGHRTRPDSHINTHIDAANSASDMRIVECMKGSGTLIFDDNDFTIFTNNGVELLESGITCWSLMEGSSVAIRMPSLKNEAIGGKPTVHAHGIGQEDDTPEERLTVRHDLVLD